MPIVGPGILGLLVAFIALSSPAAAADGVYKWTDKNGVVNYSAKPPPDAQRAAAVDTRPSMSAFGDHNDAEARRLREGRQRALARDAYEAESLKCKREADERKDQQACRKAQVAAQAAGKEEARLQKAREQCRRERRVDCDRAGIAAAGGQTATRVVVRRAPQDIRKAAPLPLTGSSGGPASGTIAGTQAQLVPQRSTPAPSSRPASLRKPE